jgi:putative ABC transport system permease protein
MGLGLESRNALRSLRAAPAVSLIAVVSLALGIGANAGIFSIYNSLALRTLPVHRPERLTVLAASNEPVPAWSLPLLREIRAQELFQDVGGWSARQFDIAGSGRTEHVQGLFVSGNFFSMLGVRPALGRLLTPLDDRPGAEPSA